jgi:hypothetical protein
MDRLIGIASGPLHREMNVEVGAVEPHAIAWYISVAWRAISAPNVSEEDVAEFTAVMRRLPKTVETSPDFSQRVVRPAVEPSA